MCPNSNLLSAYFDGELAAHYENQLSDHVSGCKRCAGELASLGDLRKKLSAADNSDRHIAMRKDAVWKNIEAKLLSREKPTIFSRYLKIPLPLAAALLVLCVASGIGVTYVSMLNTGYNDAIAEIPNFTTMEELIGYLETNQHTRTMEINLPEDPVFLFVSQPTLIPESEYKEAKW